MKERKKRYIFWVGSIKYSGYIIYENDTHWVVDDVRIGKIDIPKTAVRQEMQE